MPDPAPAARPDPALGDFDAMVGSTMYALANTPMRVWPFHHLVVDGLLPPALFAAARALDLSAHTVRRRDSYEGAPAGLNPSRFFVQLLDGDGRLRVDGGPVLDTLVALLTDSLVARVLAARFQPVVTARFGGRMPLYRHALEYIDDRTGYELGPHTDVGRKLLTMLVYLADDDTDPGLGTVLYAPRGDRPILPDEPTPRIYGEADVVPVHRVDFAPNRALVFAPTARSLHGVAPVGTTPRPRRLLQLQLNVVTAAPNDSGASPA